MPAPVPVPVPPTLLVMLAAAEPEIEAVAMDPAEFEKKEGTAPCAALGEILEGDVPSLLSSPPMDSPWRSSALTNCC